MMTKCSLAIKISRNRHSNARTNDSIDTMKSTMTVMLISKFKKAPRKRIAMTAQTSLPHVFGVLRMA
jgi:hypothetical protein